MASSISASMFSASSSTRASGFGQRGFGAEEVELDFAGAGEDGGLDVGVLLVDGGGAGVDVRLGDERHAEQCAWRGSAAGREAARRGLHLVDRRVA